jgi:mannose-1-phosphate guanylyltransferase
VLREFNRHAPELADLFQLRARKTSRTLYVIASANCRGFHSITRSWKKLTASLWWEANFDWDDIGSWRAVANYFKKDKQANAANCAITALDSSNNIVFEEDGTNHRTVWSS